jgi:hypothetical protein
MFLNHYCILVGICLAIVNHAAGKPKQNNYRQDYLNEFLDSYEGKRKIRSDFKKFEIKERAPPQHNSF